jgi:hypothetical protein
MDTNKYVTVDEVVRTLLIQQGENTTHNYLRHLQLAHSGLKELTFDILGDIQIAVLTIGNTLRVDLPEDYVDYTFIGLVDSRGRLRPLGNSSRIPGKGTDNTLTPQYSTTFGNEYFNGAINLDSRHRGAIYGIGGGQNQHGQYRPSIDRENWQMVFTSIAAGEQIYMEYTSDGRAKGGRNVIHPYAEEALKAYVYWKSIQRKRGQSGQEKELARRDYYNEKRLANQRMKAFTKEEALQQIRTGFKQAPKM